MSCSYLFFSFLQLRLQENLLHAYSQTSGTHNQEFHIGGEQHKCERAIREGGIESLGADCRTVSNGPTWDNELITFYHEFPTIFEVFPPLAQRRQPCIPSIQCITYNSLIRWAAMS